MALNPSESQIARCGRLIVIGQIGQIAHHILPPHHVEIIGGQ